ncbi:sulfatase [Seonamhaeicola sp. NFXS20]|uniref:sulfatase family protein n=1 Tax=unclassified Seonamhaeicola TaxID=2622645 RepID=UPI003562AE9A
MRKHFICTVILLSGLLSNYLLLSQVKKPNFLIILGDDISASNIGCYNSKNPNTTPNIDALANEGIRFTNMFVSEAICAPTRAELYTGLMPYKNGCSKNHAATKTGTLSIVQHLQKYGYRVALTGKRHFKPQSVYPFEFIDGFEKNCNKSGTVPESWDGVEEFITRNPDQPFCLIICSINAHSPWDAGNSDLWDANKIVLPSNLVDTEKTRTYFKEYLGEIRLFDEQVGKARKLLKKNKLDTNTALMVLDENGAGMPGGKWTTYDWGVRSACVMKWPSANNNALVTSAIAQYCDILPTLIDAAGGTVPEYLDGKSLLPVIKGNTTKHRDYAFFLYNSGPEGPEFATRAVTDGRYKLIWNLTPNNLYAVRTINGFDFGYVDKMEDRHVRKMYLSWLTKAGYDKTANNLVQRYRKRPEFQLFDLSKDPEEMNNLANNPVYYSKIEELKEAIKQWMKEQKDTLIASTKN